MPRQARLDAPGTLHHVIMRGIEKKIVDDSHDKREFIDRMSQIALENEIKIYAWALMTNHAHILIKSGKRYWKELNKYARRKEFWFRNCDPKIEGEAASGKVEDCHGVDSGVLVYPWQSWVVIWVLPRLQCQ